MHNLFSWDKSVCRVVPLISSKCSFYSCPCTVMFSFSMTNLKEIPTMFTVGFDKKTTQPKEWLWRFELTCASIWPYPMFIEFYFMTFQWVINLIKTMLWKICIMCTIIADIKVIFFSNMSIFTSAFYMINTLFNVSI